MSCVSPKMPAQRCEMRGGSPISSPRKRSSDAWIAGVVTSTSVSSSRIETSRKPPSSDAPVGQLLPVIEALARVVRAVVEDAVERLAHDHLAARRPDRFRELAHEPVPVAVGGDDDLVGVERSQVVDALVLAELGARLGRARGEPAHEARRLDRAVARMDDHAVEAAGEHAGEVVEPLDLEAVLAQRLVLGADLLPLLLVGGEAVAADSVERVARELRQPVGSASVQCHSSRACSRPYVSRAMS